MKDKEEKLIEIYEEGERFFDKIGKYILYLFGFVGIGVAIAGIFYVLG